MNQRLCHRVRSTLANRLDSATPASAQAAYRSLRRERQSSFIPLCFLSDGRSLRWIAHRFPATGGARKRPPAVCRNYQIGTSPFVFCRIDCHVGLRPPRNDTDGRPHLSLRGRCAPVAICSLFTIHYSRFTIHDSLLTIPCSRFPVHDFIFPRYRYAA